MYCNISCNCLLVWNIVIVPYVIQKKRIVSPNPDSVNKKTMPIPQSISSFPFSMAFFRGHKWIWKNGRIRSNCVKFNRAMMASQRLINSKRLRLLFGQFRQWPMAKSTSKQFQLLLALLQMLILRWAFWANIGLGNVAVLAKGQLRLRIEHIFCELIRQKVNSEKL